MICNGPLVFAYLAFTPPCQVFPYFSFAETLLTHLSLRFRFKDGHVSHSESQGLAYIDRHMILRYWEKDVLFLLEKLSKMKAQSIFAAVLRMNTEECRAENEGDHFQMTTLEHLNWAMPQSTLGLFNCKSQKILLFALSFHFPFRLNWKWSWFIQDHKEDILFPLTSYHFQYLKLAVLSLCAFPWHLGIAGWRVS